MRRARALAASLLLGATLLASGCGGVAEEDSAPPAGRGKVVFDMAHAEIFGADDTSELGQSKAVQRIRDAGLDVTVNTDVITAEDLADAQGLILAGPMQPLRSDEYEVIDRFVRTGGTVLLTIHVPYPVMSVPKHFGLPVVPSVLASSEPASPTDPSIFFARGVQASQLTEGVDEVLIVSGWPVEAAGEAAVLAVSTGPDAWIDSDQDGARTEADRSGPMGVVGVANVGEGRVIVVGDDAVFANVGIDKGDNARLFDNVLRFMAGARET